jgi:hypothetical protein
MSITPHLDVAGVQRVEHLHLIGHIGDVDHLGRDRMKPFQGAARMLGVESARRHVLRGQIIEHRAGHCGFADTALVGADEKNDWFHAPNSLFPARGPGQRLVVRRALLVRNGARLLTTTF